MNQAPAKAGTSPMVTFSQAEIELIARTFFGEPNKSLSSKTQLRFGAHGSKAVDLFNGKWFDHETSGGDMSTLVKREKGLTDKQTFEWLESNNLKPINGNGADANIISYDAAADSFKNGVAFKNGNKLFRTVQAWVYCDEAGNELFEVCRKENGETGADGKPQKTYSQRHKGANGYIENVKV